MVPILVLGLLFGLLAIGTPVGFAMAFSGSIGLLIVGGTLGAVRHPADRAAVDGVVL